MRNFSSLVHTIVASERKYQKEVAKYLDENMTTLDHIYPPE